MRSDHAPYLKLCSFEEVSLVSIFCGLKSYDEHPIAESCVCSCE